MLENSHFKVTSKGVGKVKSQSIQPGTVYTKNQTLILGIELMVMLQDILYKVNHPALFRAALNIDGERCAVDSRKSNPVVSLLRLKACMRMDITLLIAAVKQGALAIMCEVTASKQ